MDITQCLYFITIVEEGSINRAAEKLYVSQPSLSRFLHKQEKALGVLLFVRGNSNALTITEAGTRYLTFCRNVIKEHDELLGALRKDRQKGESRIRYGVTGEKSAAQLASVLPSFKGMHPDVKVDITIQPVKELNALLLEGNLDFYKSAYLQKDPALYYRDIAMRPMDLVVPLSHPFAALGHAVASDSMPAVSLHDLANETFVLHDGNTVQRNILNRYFSENHFEPRVIAEVATSMSALAIIETGLAVGILPRIYASSKVRFLRLDPPLSRPLAYIYRRDHYLDQAQEDLLKLLGEADV